MIHRRDAETERFTTENTEDTEDNLPPPVRRGRAGEGASAEAGPLKPGEHTTAD
jgi:hypothetical protein